MPGHVAAAGFVRHVRASQHTVTASYAPLRVPAAGSSATATAPSNPLTGPRTTPVLVPPALTPAKPTTGPLQCLWYDQTQVPTDQVNGKEERRFPLAGWRQGTLAVAAFVLTDVLTDPTQPYGSTVFSDCDAVTHLGQRFHVLGFDVSGSGGLLPYAGYLWLGSLES